MQHTFKKTRHHEVEMEVPAVVQCLQCKAQLVITATNASEPSTASVLPASLDESFLILEKALSGRHQAQISPGAYTNLLTGSLPFLIFASAMSYPLIPPWQYIFSC